MSRSRQLVAGLQALGFLEHANQEGHRVFYKQGHWGKYFLSAEGVLLYGKSIQNCSDALSAPYILDCGARTE